jgi:hypothetical protein
MAKIPTEYSARDFEQIVRELETRVATLETQGTVKEIKSINQEGHQALKDGQFGFHVDDSQNASLGLRWRGRFYRFGGLEIKSGATPTVTSSGWSVSNLTEDKTYDADATSTAELADVLGTLITFLLNRGDIKA